jgi:hypothetical protein
MEPHRNERVDLYRPRLPQRVPRSVPDDEFNEIFARLASHQDRARANWASRSGCLMPSVVFAVP